MLRRALLISILTAPSITPAIALTSNSQNPYPLTTSNFATIRRGPGTNWAAIGAIPPATIVQVDYCATRWLPRWCEVTYKGITGFVHSSLLQTRANPPTSGGSSRSKAARPIRRSNIALSKPAFLKQAEEAAVRADNSVRAAQANLNQLLRQEARQSQKAMIQTGSWIEPASLWRQKVAAQQNLKFQEELARQAQARLVNAQDRARALWETKWSESHTPSWFSSWWQW